MRFNVEIWKLNFIFDNNRLEINVPSSSIVQVPIVTKKQYTLIDISEDMYVSMIDEDNKLKEDGRLRNDLEIWTRDSKIDIIR